MIIEDARENRQLAETLTNENVLGKTDRCAREILVAALGDDQLRAIRVCTSIKQAWKKLQARYASGSTISELRILNVLLKIRLNNATSVGDHVLSMEA